MRAWSVAAAIAVAGLAASPGFGGGLKPPALPDAAVIDAAVARYPESDLVVVREWIGVEARSRPAEDGLGGRLRAERAYRIVTRKGVESASILTTTDDPRQTLEDVRVEVVHGGKTTRYERRQLKWSTVTRRADGVVTLDGTISQGLVPGLQPGDELRIVEEYELHGVHGLPTVVLGDERRPTLAATFELRVPVDYEIVWGGSGGSFARGHVAYAEQQDGGSAIHRWSLEADGEGAVPECRGAYAAYRVIPQVASAGSDGPAGMATGRTWSEVGAAYLARIEGVFAADQAVRDAVASAVGDAASPLEKIDRIYAYVQKRCRYLGLFEGTGGLLPASASAVLSSGFGDCKGLGTLLIAMLREAGFTAHPVLVRTESAGAIDAGVPSMVQFNHYIAWVDTGGPGMFLDGVVEYFPAGLLPAMDGVSAALLLAPDAVRIVGIPAAAWAPGTAAYRISGRIGDQGGLEMTTVLQASGNLGAIWRAALGGATAQERSRYLGRALLPRGFALDAEQPRIDGLDRWRDPLGLALDAKARGPLPGDARSVFLPRQLAGSPLELKAEPDCGPPLDVRRYADRTELWEIELPAGLELVPPGDLDIEDGGVAWRCRVRQDGNRLLVERTVGFTQDLMDAEALAAARRTLASALQQDSGYFELRRR